MRPTARHLREFMREPCGPLQGRCRPDSSVTRQQRRIVSDQIATDQFFAERIPTGRIASGRIASGQFATEPHAQARRARPERLEA